MEFYRYTEDDQTPVSYDMNGEPYIDNSFSISYVCLRLNSFNMVSETKCGYWISGGWGYEKKWVSKTSKKRFAYPTKQEALQAYVYRKKSQIKILSNRLDIAKQGKRMAEEQLKDINNDKLLHTPQMMQMSVEIDDDNYIEDLN